MAYLFGNINFQSNSKFLDSQNYIQLKNMSQKVSTVY